MVSLLFLSKDGFGISHKNWYAIKQRDQTSWLDFQTNSAEQKHEFWFNTFQMKNFYHHVLFFCKQNKKKPDSIRVMIKFSTSKLMCCL